MNNLLKPYHNLEIDAHVSLDDVLSKTTQEMGEILIAIEENNQPEITKESADLLINILSVMVRLDINPQTEPNQNNDFGTFVSKSTKSINSELPLLLAEWHREVAALRWKYSRDIPRKEILQELSQRLIHTLLPLTKTGSIENVVKNCTEKFRARVDKYIPDINLYDYIQAHADFPKPGILFQDISPLLTCPKAMQFACFELAKRAKGADVIAGLDTRGFLFGIPVAQILNKPFVMIRKKWKLPGKTISTDYSLEYGKNTIEIQEWAIQSGQNVVIVDDLLATGGTLLAAASLVEKIGWWVEWVLALIWLENTELKNHPFRQKLNAYRNESVLHVS